MGDSIKIGQIAPLYESVPPKLYGGTERMVHYLTEELVKSGNEVTLFATADSVTNARLIVNVDEGLRLKHSCVDPLAYHIVQLQEVIERASEFDILHFHTDYLHFPVSSQLKTTCITTLHGRLDIADLQCVYNKFKRQKVVSISDSQRKPLPQANWVGTVYHGIPQDLHQKGNGDGGYLAFLGRVSPEKGVDRAIDIAIASGNRIKIAAKIDKADAQYFEKHIKPMLNHPLVDFVGEITEVQKADFLGKAKGVLFPIDWAEPFGLVMIESMACGTPVIAFRKGSVPEIIDHGITGFIVDSVEGALKSIENIGQLSRSVIRTVFEKRFTAARMAADYLKVYSSLTQKDILKDPLSNYKHAERIN